MATGAGDSVTTGGPNAGHADPLRAFTTTAEVPAVGRLDPRSGMAPGVIRVRRPAPLALRVAVWLTALLVLVSLAGLGIHRLRPSALGALEVKASPGVGVRPAPTSTPTTSAHARTTPAEPVSQTAATATGATLEVAAAQYTIKVSAQAPCWVQVTAPGSPAPVFGGTLATGDVKTFSAVNGQIQLLLGARRVTVSVLFAGKATPLWTFTPTNAPYELRFTSASV